MHSFYDKKLAGFRADLHCHSTFSDGTLTPFALVDLAADVGLSALAITDHDTVEAYNGLFSYAKQKGIALGTGVEFSAGHKNHSIHVLGYDIDISSLPLLQFCQKQKERRLERNLKILQKLNNLGFVVEEKDIEDKALKDRRTTGRPHIAQVMLDKGYVTSFQQAFTLYLGDGCKCYVPGDLPSLPEVIDCIKQAGGKAFLAHPQLCHSMRIVREVLSLGFDGLECYYGRCLPEQEKRWLKLAEERALLVSGGSDFHGDVKPHIPLGCSWVNEEVFNKIFTHGRIY